MQKNMRNIATNIGFKYFLNNNNKSNNYGIIMHL